VGILDGLRGLPIQRSTFIASWANLRAEVEEDPGRICWVSSAGARWAMTASTSDGWVYAWSRETGEVAYTNKIGNRPLVFLPQKGELVGAVQIVRGMPHFEIRLVGWNLERGQLVGSIEDARFGPPLCFPSLADRGWIGYPSTNRTIVVYDFLR
jgi:hypothetical protein